MNRREDTAAYGNMQDEGSLVSSATQGKEGPEIRLYVAHLLLFLLSFSPARAWNVSHTRQPVSRHLHPFSFELARANLPPISLVCGELSRRVLIGGASDLIHLP
ncbi:hypothetical protein BaRGS_00024202 [Batillaria attramentaria]|uniref:Uncharacterized protein n=1 Tax=Batillaria attramentaria TaxID=370345 RepID=A0ABD0KBT9_9CAEN